MTDVRLAASTTPGHKLLGAFGTMTDVRLAASTHPNHMHHRALAPTAAMTDPDCTLNLTLLPMGKDEARMTDVRLAANMKQGRGKLDRSLPRAEDPAMTDVRLVGAAWGGANEQIAGGVRERAALPPERRPALLVSYAYFDGFQRFRPRYAFRDYMLDSGAYSAFTVGARIDLDRFIDFCLERLATDPQCVEIIQLDVLHDWRKGQQNLRRMWDRGVPAIPVWHWNEPESLLQEYASAAPKIAVGVREKSTERKRWFYEQVFARVWPCRVHGLAIGSPELLRAVPFHSADATNWILGPAGYGQYKSMPKPARAPRGKALNLKVEVEWWLKLERELKQRWGPTLATIAATRGDWPLRSWPPPAVATRPASAAPSPLAAR